MGNAFQKLPRAPDSAEDSTRTRRAIDAIKSLDPFIIEVGDEAGGDLEGTYPDPTVNPDIFPDAFSLVEFKNFLALTLQQMNLPFSNQLVYGGLPYVQALVNMLVKQPAQTVIPSTNDFRLSAVTATAVPTTDTTAPAIVYLTPFKGTRIATYDSGTWTYHTSNEISLTLGGMTTGKNYDIFVFANGMALALTLGSAWTSDTARAETLTQQDGVWVRTANKAMRHVGILRATAATTYSDVGGSGATAATRYLINRDNRVPRPIHACPGYVDDNAITVYTTSSTTWAETNGGTGSKAQFLTLTDTPCCARGHMIGLHSAIAGTIAVGVGEDSATNATVAGSVTEHGTGGVPCSVSVSHEKVFTTDGYHYFDLLMVTSGLTLTVRADGARTGGTADPYMTYLSGTIWG